MNWGSLSTDPNNNVIFVNDMRLGLWVQMIPQKTDSGPASNGGEAVNTGMGAVPLKGTPYAVNKNRFMSPLGIPCQKPPFGSLGGRSEDPERFCGKSRSAPCRTPVRSASRCA
jgi:quinate dehydrogenase (quinone)